MGSPATRQEQKYTYKDYPGWPDDEFETVVQPDLSVICDKSKIDERGAKAAFDLVIEGTSPSTVGKDMKQKLVLYERRGVKEYWIIHAFDRVVEIYSSTWQGKYGKPKCTQEKKKLKQDSSPVA